MRGIAHATFVRETRAGLDAKHGVMGGRIAGVDVVDIIRGHDAQLEFFGELQEVGDDALLFFETVVHNLDDEVFAPEDLDEPSAGLAGGLVIALQ